MTTTYDIERILDTWFEAGPRLAPDGSIDRALAATIGIRQVRPGLSWPRVVDRPGLRTAVVVPAIGVMVLGVALVASIAPWSAPSVAAPTSSPTAAPTASPSPTATARPASDITAQPQPSLESTYWSKPFASGVHDYGLLHPASWRAEAATGSSDPDTFTGPDGTTLSISTRPLPPGQSPTPGAMAEWADAELEHHFDTTAERPQCTWTPGGTMFPKDFVITKVGGRVAVSRGECQFVDAVVPVGDRIYVLVLKSSKHRPGGDEAMFADISNAIRFTGDWTDGRSDRYGYRMSRPAAWVVRPATRAWTLERDRSEWDSEAADGYVPPDDAPYVSVFSAPWTGQPRGWHTVYRAVIGNRAPYQASPRPCFPDFQQLVHVDVGGRPGLISLGCDQTAAYVFGDGVVHVFTVWRADEEALLYPLLSTVEFGP